MSQKIPGWVWLAGLAGVGYALWKISGAFKQGVNYVTAPVSDAIASAINWYTATPPVITAGNVLFPNGALVPTTNFQVTSYNGPQGFEARVTYQGRVYRLAEHDANGNYPATPV